jgi:hypothetical protein
MPYYKKSRKRTYKKKRSNRLARKGFKKRWNRNKQNQVKTYIGNPFPGRIKVKQNVSQCGTTINQSNINSVTYKSLINLYQSFPFQQSGMTNESAQWHRIYTNYYDKFQVEFAYISVTIMNTGIDDCKVVAAISDDQDIVGNMQNNNVNISEATMQPWSQSRTLEANGGSRYNRTTFNFKFNLGTWAKRNNVTDAQRYGYLGGSTTPVLYPQLYLALQSVQGNNLATINVQSKVSFYSSYFDRQDASIAAVQ